MVPLYDLSTTNFSCKVAIGPLNPHQGAALDPIFQIFPRFWSFLVGSTGFLLLSSVSCQCTDISHDTLQ